MDPAWIGFAGGVVGTVVSAAVALRQSHTDRELVLLKDDLDRAARAEEVLQRYEQPLATAAFDLQSRLYNILELDFVAKFGGEHPRRDEASRTTLFRVAQYFGWSEILRRDIQFLRYSADQRTRDVAEKQREIAELFLHSGEGEAWMIWRDEQRAIGELMIVDDHDRVACMGYARFSACCKKDFGPWLERLWAEVPEPGAQERMRKLQQALHELVELLDDGGVLTIPRPRMPDGA